MASTASHQSSTANRQWRLRNRPVGIVDGDTFELTECPVPQPREGEFCVRLIFLSLAPVMRAYIVDGGVIEERLPIGSVMRGRGVGEVIASHHPGFAVGDIVHGPFGWQDYAISDGSGRVLKLNARVGSSSLALGALGLTGFTAYFGLFDIGRPTAGDQVLVSGAAGGVGSVAGQLARIAGCRTVGTCGGRDKSRWIVDALGYDAAIDYRGADLASAIREALPDGIDIYFDNVGGALLEAAIDHIRNDGRIVVCGSISQYLSGEDKRGPSNYFDLVYRNARMHGFHIYHYENRFREAEERLATWIEEGRLAPAEDRRSGFETMPEALRGLFESANFGKCVVQIGDDPLA
ncbi:Putative NADP-dependent oxidoreductase YfmJ [Tsuneonella dongtanensis]|uniref:Putative NADP-dependent oxidoreductase YfmJ n=2 Tax=Tsuneonella dongtanensis TaxID=692370 RepID=A0A1B2A915_9SPHN|nr:Putative NADP-dependent oxidoreductase YfmJ [Tsuneonella dongtanensis]